MPHVEPSRAGASSGVRAGVSAANWVTAGYAVFAARGLTAIRVESLARDLGVTKGSFYWHFADRRALISAVVQRWETEHTEAIIIESARGQTPAERLHRLVAAVTAGTGQSPGLQLLYVEAEREGVGEALDRVTARRIDYLRGLLEQLGQAPEEAERRAVLALSASLGMQQLVVGAPAAMNRRSLQRDQLITFLYAILVG